VVLPMDAHGPIRMLQAVTARTQRLKECGALGFVALAAKWLSAAPPPLHAMFWSSIPEIILPVPALNIICTNVVGSPAPLYAVGRKMLAAYPHVPTGYDLGVGCAVHSYNGKLFWGLVGDTEAAPDVERLRDFVAESFEDLQKAVARKKARSEQRTVRKGAEQQKPSTQRDRNNIPGKPQSGLLAETTEPRVVKRSKEAA
jgi:diacylglycerol O-acyltransferase / wax synthase